jgi:hypothetical protein
MPIAGEVRIAKSISWLTTVAAELVARPYIGCSVFQIEFIPGVALAELTETLAIDSSTVTVEVNVNTGKRRPIVFRSFRMPSVLTPR